MQIPGVCHVKSAFLSLFSLLAVMSLSVTQAGQDTVPLKSGKERIPSKPPQIVEAYSRLALSFEANQGQTDPQVKFLSRSNGYTLFLTANEAVLRIPNRIKSSQPDRLPQFTPASIPTQRLAHKGAARAPSEAHTALRMRLAEANPNPKVLGLEEYPGKSNYFVGNDAKKWRTNVPIYARVKYADVYPGISLIFYGNQQQLEYDFVVSPGADPGVILLAFEGAERVTLDGQGNLILHTPEGSVVQRAPACYQEIDGVKEGVRGSYVIKDRNRVGFNIAGYDSGKSLVIDPVLVYSTLLGGSSGAFEDNAVSLKVDTDGNVYVTGYTGSADFPREGPIQPAYGGGIFDCYVAKLNPAGSALIYSTYLGGNQWDACNGIAVDSGSNAYVVGTTYSTNLPTVNGFQPTYPGGLHVVFVTKLNAAGNTVLYSSYLGGNGTGDGSGAITVDSAGNAYVTGGASSTNFPVTPGAFQTTGGSYYGDAFVTKIDTTKSGPTSLVYSTYLGGNLGHGGEQGLGIAVDSAGNAYVTGATASTNFPTTLGAYDATCGTDGNCNGWGGTDAFITKLNSGGSILVYSTYLGGSGSEGTYCIALDESGNAYVTGGTGSADFPTLNPFQSSLAGGATFEFGPDAFVTKLNPSGTALVYSTYLGGSGDELGHRIAIDASGNAYIIGLTNSTNFPTMNPLQASNGGGRDAFVTKLNSGGALLFSSYLGGSGDDGGGGIASDEGGNVYISGGTNSTNFPTTPGTFQTSNAGYYDAFVAKICVAASAGPTAADLLATPNPVGVGFGITLTTNVSSFTNTIASAEFSIEGGPFSVMTPGDGVFDERSENVAVSTPDFMDPGVYSICVRGTDTCLNVGSPECILLAVYDPNGGFVTGGGWINSPNGSYTANPSLGGKATFGFVSKYEKGATIPTGQTEFQFRVADFNFHSSSYEWLVVAGPKAQYKGIGTVNGAGNYGFLLTATDGQLPGGGGADKFRIKIWDKNTGSVVYDNVFGMSDDIDNANPQVVSGGSIVIHSQ